MREKEHHIQDALELLTVARLQQMAEDRDVSLSNDAHEKFEEFEHYARMRGLQDSDFTAGPYAGYRRSLDIHLPTFFQRLLVQYSGERMDFVNVEVEYRNRGKKGDFEIRPEDSRPVSVSLKNYRSNADNPQFNAQTFNSFALSMLFAKGPAVGQFIDTGTGRSFQGSNKAMRDGALQASGFGHVLSLFHRLDALQNEIRSTFVGTPEWEFLDEERFDPIRKSVGLRGAEAMAELMTILPDALIKKRLLTMAGLDGSEALLIVDPRVMAESVTDLSPLKRLYSDVKEDACAVVVQRQGQTLQFDLVVNGRVLVEVRVPHTINKNGAWIDDEAYAGGRYHSKERMVLENLQRRPRKSKQISTSINTYVNLRKAGIFIEEGPES